MGKEGLRHKCRDWDQNRAFKGDEDRENQENNKSQKVLKKKEMVSVKAYINVKQCATRTLSVPLTGATSIIFKWKYHM